MQNSSNNNGGDSAKRNYLLGLKCFIRRKHVDSILVKREGTEQLAKKLSFIGLIAVEVGATIGCGAYFLVGSVAREQTGPALTMSFLIMHNLLVSALLLGVPIITLTSALEKG